ncbi:Eukaryotic translation initiation factor 3 subunit J [Irineochytrium annulatum]|nr:Eukaryotic translation initiation factor 3 subunit J [Irineochytrium annulatum]
MSDDWEEDDNAIVPPVAVALTKPGQWDDEDAEEEDVKDAWDASDDEGGEKKAAATAATATGSPKPKKKKAGLKEKIAERAAAEQKKKEELAAKRRAEEEDPYANETPEERRRRLEESIRESDLANARDLFGVNDARPSAPAASFLETMKPTTKPDFEQFEGLLLDKLTPLEKSTHFPFFVEQLTRDLAVSLSVDDIKRIAATLNALANEKSKAAKPVVKKKGAAGKVVPKMGRSSRADTTNYEDDYDEIDDFM